MNTIIILKIIFSYQFNYNIKNLSKIFSYFISPFKIQSFNSVYFVLKHKPNIIPIMDNLFDVKGIINPSILKVEWRHKLSNTMTFTHHFIYIGLFVLFFTSSLLSEEITEYAPHIYRISSRNTKEARELLESAIEESKLNDFEVIGHDDDHIYISKENIPESILSEDDLRVSKDSTETFKKVAEQLSEVEYLGKHGSIPLNLLPNFFESLNNKIPKGYTSPKEISSIFQNIAKKHSFTQWIDIAKKFNNGTSIEGRPIHALRINYKPNENKPSILIVSCHHARELITPEIAIHLAKTLVSGVNQRNSKITKWLETYDIWIIPVLNVDGHEFVWKKNNMWRKNRRSLSNGLFGVDLNRNYDLGWDTQGGESYAGSETYRGSAPFSEPETQALKKLSEAMKFAKVLDFHSSGQEVLIHYSRLPMPAAMQKFIENEGKKLSKLAGYGTRVPSDDGEHQEWQIKTNTAYSFLVETGTSFQPPYSAAVKESIRVWPLVKAFFDRPITLSGKVTDNKGTPIPNVDIKVLGIDWQLGESRQSHPKTGNYHLFLPKGEYKIQFSCPEHKEKSVTIKVENNKFSKVLNVQLEPKA